MTTATQTRYPWRAVARTMIAVGIPGILSVAVVIPAIIEIILDEAGEAMPPGLRVRLLAVSAAATIVAGIITRILAIPAVEAFLRAHRLLSGLAAQPSDGSSR